MKKSTYDSRLKRSRAKERSMFACPRAKIIKTMDRFGSTAEVVTPCGKCDICLQKRREEWVTRIHSELLFHKEALYVTITYDDDHLPPSAYVDPAEKINGSLEKSDYQKWLKKIRAHLDYRYPTYAGKLRYFLVGEYGGKTGRPHYHALLFGVPPMILDPLVREAWHGGSIVDTDVVFSDNANPLSTTGKNSKRGSTKAIRYLLKYLNKTFISRDSDGTGRIPEFVTCSRKPMLGDYFSLDLGRSLRKKNLFFLPALPISQLRHLEKQIEANPDLLGDLIDYSDRVSPHIDTIIDPFRFDPTVEFSTHNNVYIRFAGKIYKTLPANYILSNRNGWSMPLTLRPLMPDSNYDGDRLRMPPHMRTKLFYGAFPELVPLLEEFEQRYPSDIRDPRSRLNCFGDPDVSTALAHYAAGMVSYYKQWFGSDVHHSLAAKEEAVNRKIRRDRLFDKM